MRRCDAPFPVPPILPWSSLLQVELLAGTGASAIRGAGSGGGNRELHACHPPGFQDWGLESYPKGITILFPPLSFEKRAEQEDFGAGRQGRKLGTLR